MWFQKILWFTVHKLLVYLSQEHWVSVAKSHNTTQCPSQHPARGQLKTPQVHTLFRSLHWLTSSEFSFIWEWQLSTSWWSSFLELAVSSSPSLVGWVRWVSCHHILKCKCANLATHWPVSKSTLLANLLPDHESPKHLSSPISWHLLSMQPPWFPVSCHSHPALVSE